MSVRWCKENPGRARYELRKLREAGFRFRPVVKDLRRGLLALEGTIKISDEEISLIIKFPDLYPYFRCEFYAPDMELSHHQNPFAKNLCMLSRSTKHWTPHDTAASVLLEQLPKVIIASRTETKEEAAEIEELQGEPISQYIHIYEAGPCVFYDSSWRVDQGVNNGILLLGKIPQGRDDQWAVIEVQDENGRRLVGAAAEISGRYSEIARGKWVRVNGRIRSADPHELFRHVADTNYWSSEAGIFGLLIEEEFLWRETGDGWIFIRRLTKNEARQKKKNHRTPEVIRGMRAGREDLLSRTPELRNLGCKKVLIVGLGCLGAPSALEFARNGVGELRLLEHDIVEAGTISRWPFGIHAAGLPKLYYLEWYIRNNYPFCNPLPISCRIGAVRGMSGSTEEESQTDVIEKAVKDVDLIYDASAEIGVQRFLSDIAWDLSIPYVKVSGTPGMWGGEVARIVPGNTKGCWLCMYQAQEDLKLRVARAAPGGILYPAGCGAVTFTGASFDSNIIALTGVRLAIATLLKNDQGYPDFEWDVAIIDLRDETGSPIPPRFDTFPLQVYSKCPSRRH